MSVVPEIKRASQRVRLDLLVMVETDGSALPALVVDVGMGGMFIAGPPLSYGQFIDIIAQLPGITGRARLPAVVRWTRSIGVGVQFLELREDVTSALRRLVAGSDPS